MVEKKTRRKAAPVEIARLGINALEPDIREEVLRLAGGDGRRVEVLSSREAIVR